MLKLRMRTLWALLAVLLLMVLTASAVAAAGRAVPRKDQSTVVSDIEAKLPGNLADLKQALMERSVVRYQVVLIDDSADEDREAYLDRVLADWGWPAHDTLLVVVYTTGNFDIRFAMGADFAKSGVTVAELVGFIHNVYVPNLRKGDPAHALAELIRTVNGRMAPKAGLTPEQVVDRFYAWHIGSFSPTDKWLSGNPLVDRSYRQSPYLAKSAVTELDQELDAMAAGGGMDPVLCAQALPLDLKTHDAVITGANEAKVDVDTVWGTPSAPTIRESIQVGLTRQDGQWAISTITCKR